MRNTIYRRFNLTIALTLFLTAMMLISIMIVGGTLVLLRSIGLFDIFEIMRIYRFFPLIGVLMVNFLIATALTSLFSRTALRRLKEIIKATHQVAKGNFNIKVDEGEGIAELKELSVSFNKMTQDLSGIETLRSDFINNFSHEFKTPIVSIRGFAKLLEDDSLSADERKEYLDIIISESGRLSMLATNVLNLSKYENMNIIGDKTVFRLDEQIRRTIVMSEPKWSEKGLKVDVKLDEVSFNGNADLTQQVWLNLIDNAIKFTNPGGNIEIELIQCSDNIRFSIADDGIGIDESAKDKIFERFYQDDSSRTTSGNGIGLAIVKRIIKLYEGTIEVQSVINKGSVFTVYLPKEGLFAHENEKNLYHTESD